MEAYLVLSASLGRDVERARSIALNVANSATPGFKRWVDGDVELPAAASGSDVLGEKDLSPGKAIVTNRPLDVFLPKGVYLEVDNIGYLDYQPESVRADNVAGLVKAGFVNRVLLSEDICMLNHLKYTGGKGYGYIFEVFLPLLRERGVTDEQIHQMMVINPANAFSRRRRDAV